MTYHPSYVKPDGRRISYCGQEKNEFWLKPTEQIVFKDVSFAAFETNILPHAAGCTNCTRAFYKVWVTENHPDLNLVTLPGVVGTRDREVRLNKEVPIARLRQVGGGRYPQWRTQRLTAETAGGWNDHGVVGLYGRFRDHFSSMWEALAFVSTHRDDFKSFEDLAPERARLEAENDRARSERAAAKAEWEEDKEVLGSLLSSGRLSNREYSALYNLLKRE